MNKKPLYFVISVLAASLSACSDSQNTTTSSEHLYQVEFTPVKVSEQPATSILASPQVSVNQTEAKLNYQTLFRTGDKNNGETFGLIKDANSKAIQFSDGSPYICSGTNEGAGSGMDHISILQKDNRLFMVSQYECAIGAMYLNELEQDQQGNLSVKPNSLQFIDQSSEFGGYVHCAGQSTPWQSHLGSEEYEPDARAVEQNFDPRTGLTGIGYYDEQRFFWQGDLTRANPYYYGWVPEVKLQERNNNVSPLYTKHYSMGRFSHELAYVMPDQKTVYLSDDGTNGGFYLYIADKPQDLSSGHLYAAKWISMSDQGLGEAQIHWVDLGKSSDAEIRNYVAKRTKFSQIYETAKMDEQGQCPSGFNAVNTTYGAECLQLKDVNGDAQVSRSDEIIAAHLETRRTAAYLGATTEFRKAEGIAFNPQQKTLYLAISEVARGMENNRKKGNPNNKYDLGGQNDINLAYNPCGGVYQLALDKNEAMQSDYVVSSIKGLIAGTPQDDNLNQCSLNSLANPDNLSFLANSNSLIIGEDSDLHQNNLVWSLNIDNRQLTPVFSAPTGAETTSPFWHKDINGFSYITVVSQHPLKGSVANQPTEAGYLGPIKLK